MSSSLSISDRWAVFGRLDWLFLVRRMCRREPGGSNGYDQPSTKHERGQSGTGMYTIHRDHATVAEVSILGKNGHSGTRHR